MPIYLNNTSYDIAFGVKPIEKMGGDNIVTYSMYGEEPPMKENTNFSWYSDVPGEYTINIPKKGIYLLTLVAGGGGGFIFYDSSRDNYACSSGGSGSCFKGEVELYEGEYVIAVGNYGTKKRIRGTECQGGKAAAGTSSIISLNGVDLIKTYGGTGGELTDGGLVIAWGQGGKQYTSSSNINIINVINSDAGNRGNVKSTSNTTDTCYGGESVCIIDNINYGAGGDAHPTNETNGIAGYASVEFIRK